MFLFTPVTTNYIPVRDIAAAASWYAQKFGLRPRPTQFDDGQNGVELVLSDEIFFVLGPGNPSADETPMLYASHIEKARDFLITRGVNVTEVRQDRQGTHFFELRYLDGNVVEICEDH